jgi:hypothetical protein
VDQDLVIMVHPLHPHQLLLRGLLLKDAMLVIVQAEVVHHNVVPPLLEEEDEEDLLELPLRLIHKHNLDLC